MYSFNILIRNFTSEEKKRFGCLPTYLIFYTCETIYPFMYVYFVIYYTEIKLYSLKIIFQILYDFIITFKIEIIILHYIS